MITSRCRNVDRPTRARVGGGGGGWATIPNVGDTEIYHHKARKPRMIVIPWEIAVHVQREDFPHAPVRDQTHRLPTMRGRLGWFGSEVSYIRLLEMVVTHALLNRLIGFEGMHLESPNLG